MTQYLNPWHKPKLPNYGPEYFQTESKPILHAGCEIYNKSDVVKNGVCIAQRAKLEGAKRAAELVQDMPRPTYRDVQRRELEAQGVVFCRVCDHEKGYCDSDCACPECLRDKDD